MPFERDRVELGERAAVALMRENEVPLVTRDLYVRDLGLLATEKRCHETWSEVSR